MSVFEADDSKISCDNTPSCHLCRLLENCKSAISEQTFAERSAKLWEIQSAIEELLLSLEEKQGQLSEAPAEQMEEKKC